MGYLWVVSKKQLQNAWYTGIPSIGRGDGTNMGNSSNPLKKIDAGQSPKRIGLYDINLSNEQYKTKFLLTFRFFGRRGWSNFPGIVFISIYQI